MKIVQQNVHWPLISILFIHYFFFLLNWIEINRLKVCNTHTYTRWVHDHTISGINWVQKSLAWFKAQRPVLFLYNCEISIQYWKEKEKQRNWRKNEFKRFWHSTRIHFENTTRCYEIILHTSISYIFAISMNCRSCIKFHANSNKSYNMRTCPLRNTVLLIILQTFFNQKMRGNNVNGMVVCHLSSIFQSFNLKTIKTPYIFLST